MEMMKSYFATRADNTNLKQTVGWMATQAVVLVFALVGMTFLSSYLSMMVARGSKMEDISLVNMAGTAVQTDAARAYYNTTEGFFAEPVGNYADVYLVFQEDG